ncbi:MAG TPA: glycosyltransferase family 4 protein [Thermoanaerobaculia bacterium]
MTPPLRIALVAASPAIVGGHSVQAQGLVERLSAAGHDVTFVPIDASFPKGLRWMRRWPYARTLLNEALYFASLHRLASVDIVHVFSASYWSFLLGPAPAIVAAKLLRKRVVLHYHSGEADDHLRRWRRSVRPLLRLVDEIVVPSSYLERVFASHGYRARVIPNWIDISRFRYRERSVPRPRILSVRNLERHYGVETIMHAFARLKQRYPEATLTIAGHGRQERALRLLADQLAISGIRFVGRIESTGMPELYDAADIFVNASVTDNQPVSILEAFAAGIPVVSTSTGDIPSILRGGEAGVLVNADDSEAAAEAIARLLEQPEFAIKIARRAREEAERYTWRRVGHEWNTLYAELLSTRSAEVLAHGA